MTKHVHTTVEGLAWHSHPHKASHRVDIDAAHPLPDGQRDRLRLHDGRTPGLAVTCGPKCVADMAH
jgi:hypothetical protein